MKKLLLLLITVGGLASCKKTCSTVSMIADSYTGTFVRWLGKAGPAANVKITFTGDAFNGISDSTNYPSICNGTFKLTNNPDSIHFTNRCDFPANFDWSLILQGSYKMIQTGDSLYIRRTIGDLVYEEDVYSLRKL